MTKSNPRRDSFLQSLEAVKTGYIQDWFASARKASEEKYISPVLRQAFLTGAIPEVFSLFEYDTHELQSKNIYEQRFAGSKWREKNPPDILGCWFKSFRFEKEDGTYFNMRIPLDPYIINRTIIRVKRSKSFT